MRKKQTNLFAVESTPETKIIRKQAKLLDQQRKTLGDVSLEALRLATMQLAVKKLEEGLRLLQQAGIERSVSTPLSQPQMQQAPVIQHPCVMCGREGVYQSKRARVQRGVPPPWYCETHAAFQRAEDAEDQRAVAVAPSMKNETMQAAAIAPQPNAIEQQAPPTAPVRTPGLDAAMANLRGERA